ncbi:nuclear factor 7, brain-like [Mauremys reevesii]|uniref:nuclear factor 7, brain-like n=1 Tax=Mauremys reevesii TaxID=260615 RepID=UPI00193F985C|nr:nuclear factor 7, brain-like [Mauremys reevesii]
MASALDVSSLAEDLICPICLALFREPRTLECGHSFCAACLEPCAPRGQRRGLCPECRRPFAPRSAASNWALGRLAEKARLLRLDEGAQPGGGGAGWPICLEHEEPLKLFCSQDKGPICVICRDLPQHRGHVFLPVKNAVQKYQDKLKASLVPLKDNLNSATQDQRHQQKNMAELESCTQDLLGYITKEFGVLHQILQEKEQGMKETVERLKEENQAEMEERLKELDEEVTFRNETLSRARAGLDTSDHIVFLRGIKELMRRVREDQSSHGGEEDGASDEGSSSDDDDWIDEDEDVANGEEEEEEGDEDEDVANCEEEEERDEDEDEAHGEEEEEGDEDEDGDIVAVDPALEEFKDSLDFEAWQEMLGTIQAATVLDGEVTPITWN